MKCFSTFWIATGLLSQIMYRLPLICSWLPLVITSVCLSWCICARMNSWEWSTTKMFRVFWITPLAWNYPTLSELVVTFGSRRLQKTLKLLILKSKSIILLVRKKLSANLNPCWERLDSISLKSWWKTRKIILILPKSLSVTILTWKSKTTRQTFTTIDWFWLIESP